MYVLRSLFRPYISNCRRLALIQTLIDEEIGEDLREESDEEAERPVRREDR